MCKEKYINPFTEFGFKRLFGTEANKDILIHFLNTIIEEEEPIVDVTYMNPEKLGLRPQDRRAIFDIYCTTKTGHFIVEMQNARQEYFIHRCIYYTAMAISDAAKKGDWDFKLPHIYTIAILNFEAPEYDNDPAFKHVSRLCDTTTLKVVSKTPTLIFLEMKKFEKDIDQLETLTDKWMYVIKNLYLLDSYPTRLKEAIFQKLFEEAKISAFTDAERWEYEDSLKVLRDNVNIVNTAVNEGRKEMSVEIARSMKQDHIPIATIMRYTNLTEDEINRL
ncbi:MAG: Rpn family recombination-promoting nuclease/putative transposase [Bacteroidales bacterium]|nr:Rpn family recombination-promoting nuclease/putative transposase [Bacteroidales bacterium]